MATRGRLSQWLSSHLCGGWAPTPCRAWVCLSLPQTTLLLLWALAWGSSGRVWGGAGPSCAWLRCCRDSFGRAGGAAGTARTGRGADHGCASAEDLGVFRAGSRLGPCQCPRFGNLSAGARAASDAGADCGCPCASDHGGSRGSCAFSSTGARAKSYSGEDRGYACASGRGGCRGFLHAPKECVQNRTPEQIVDVPVPLILERPPWRLYMLHRSACWIVRGNRTGWWPILFALLFSWLSPASDPQLMESHSDDVSGGCADRPQGPGHVCAPQRTAPEDGRGRRVVTSAQVPEQPTPQEPGTVALARRALTRVWIAGVQRHTGAARRPGAGRFCCSMLLFRWWWTSWRTSSSSSTRWCLTSSRLLKCPRTFWTRSHSALRFGIRSWRTSWWKCQCPPFTRAPWCRASGRRSWHWPGMLLVARGSTFVNHVGPTGGWRAHAPPSGPPRFSLILVWQLHPQSRVKSWMRVFRTFHRLKKREVAGQVVARAHEHSSSSTLSSHQMARGRAGVASDVGVLAGGCASGTRCDSVTAGGCSTTSGGMVTWSRPGTWSWPCAPCTRWRASLCPLVCPGFVEVWRSKFRWTAATSSTSSLSSWVSCAENPPSFHRRRLGVLFGHSAWLDSGHVLRQSWVLLNVSLIFYVKAEPRILKSISSCSPASRGVEKCAQSILQLLCRGGGHFCMSPLHLTVICSPSGRFHRGGFGALDDSQLWVVEGLGWCWSLWVFYSQVHNQSVGSCGHTQWPPLTRVCCHNNNKAQTGVLYFFHVWPSVRA